MSRHDKDKKSEDHKKSGGCLKRMKQALPGGSGFFHIQELCLSLAPVSFILVSPPTHNATLRYVLVIFPIFPNERHRLLTTIMSRSSGIGPADAVVPFSTVIL